MEKHTVKTADGTVITLIQDAYLAGTNENPYYAARGIDGNDNEYEVRWTPVEGWEEMDDESDCCDWDSPDVITHAGATSPNLLA